MAEDFGRIIGNLKKALDPELAIPVDEKDNPINYRIVRLRTLIGELLNRQKDLTLEMEKLETNLTALLQEINETNKDDDKG